MHVHTYICMRDVCVYTSMDMLFITCKYTLSHTGTYRHAHTGTHKHTPAHTGTHRHTKAHTQSLFQSHVRARSLPLTQPRTNTQRKYAREPGKSAHKIEKPLGYINIASIVQTINPQVFKLQQYVARTYTGKVSSR